MRFGARYGCAKVLEEIGGAPEPPKGMEALMEMPPIFLVADIVYVNLTNHILSLTEEEKKKLEEFVRWGRNGEDGG